jgi:hypothetical protein
MEFFMRLVPVFLSLCIIMLSGYSEVYGRNGSGWGDFLASLCCGSIRVHPIVAAPMPAPVVFDEAWKSKYLVGDHAPAAIEEIPADVLAKVSNFNENEQPSWIRLALKYHHSDVMNLRCQMRAALLGYLVSANHLKMYYQLMDTTAGREQRAQYWGEVALNIEGNPTNPGPNR